MSTKKEDDSTVKTWRCKHCGHDEHWFDRTVMVWQDKKGKFHEDGPCYRCRKCGKEDV